LLLRYSLTTTTKARFARAARNFANGNCEVFFPITQEPINNTGLREGVEIDAGGARYLTTS
jgi:hypothetical protein